MDANCMGCAEGQHPHAIDCPHREDWHPVIHRGLVYEVRAPDAATAQVRFAQWLTTPVETDWVRRYAGQP